METYQSILLAIIQGITEFLPISSSAHLIIPLYLSDWVDQGLAFDTSVHLGSLAAVLWYFRKDIREMITGVWHHVLHRQTSEQSQLAFSLLIASLPILPVGFFMKHLVETDLRNASTIALATIIFGLLLWWADRNHRETRPDNQLGWRTALFIGFMQCLALIPGTSRSGITMTAALMAGYSRGAASRISFLLSIPAILGASSLTLFDMVKTPEPVNWQPIVLGTVVAAVSAYTCIHYFLKWINRIGFTPFVIYRLLLGAALLIWVNL